MTHIHFFSSALEIEMTRGLGEAEIGMAQMLADIIEELVGFMGCIL